MTINIAIEQKKDPDLIKIKLLEASTDKEEEFALIDRVLCRKNFDLAGKMWFPVMLKHLRAAIFKNFHDAPFAGHLDFAKTYDRIHKRFYMPEMYQNVA